MDTNSVLFVFSLCVIAVTTGLSATQWYRYFSRQPHPKD